MPSTERGGPELLGDRLGDGARLPVGARRREDEVVGHRRELGEVEDEDRGGFAVERRGETFPDLVLGGEAGLQRCGIPGRRDRASSCTPRPAPGPCPRCSCPLPDRVPKLRRRDSNRSGVENGTADPASPGTSGTRDARSRERLPLEGGDPGEARGSPPARASARSRRGCRCPSAATARRRAAARRSRAACRPCTTAARGRAPRGRSTSRAGPARARASIATRCRASVGAASLCGERRAGT